tara:strand:- start:8407 stop:9105 length:699 start_codon:yes stop_codon:yes gene_type:complete
MGKINSKEKLIDSLKDLSNSRWIDPQADISTNLDESLFKEVFYNIDVFTSVTSPLRYWQINTFVLGAIRRFSHHSDELVKKSNVSIAICAVIENGLYSDVSVLDYVAKNCLGEAQVMAARYCSVDALRAITNSKNPKVRKVAYERLGPVECLDDMIIDKKAEIREMGIKMAPVGYSGLNSLTKEIARGPFTLLVSKISAEYLPMLMANRNLKNKWITNCLEARLLSEGEKDE